MSPIATKSITTTATYSAIDFMKHKVVPLGFDDYLRDTKGGKVVSYGFAAYACGQTIYSLFCNDPIERANRTGYKLK